MFSPVKDLSGKKFRYLTVIKLTDKRTKDRGAMWLCRCECGKEIEVMSRSLIRGGRVSCGCKRRGFVASNWRGYEGLSATSFNRVYSRAKLLKKKFNLTPKYLWELYESQNHCCALTDYPIILNETRNTRTKKLILEKTASLDRIDNERGYIKGNVQWVHKDINFMKGTLTQSRFEELCLAVAQRRKNEQRETIRH